MRLIDYSFSISQANYGRWVNGQHTGARLSIYGTVVLDHVELTHGRLLRTTTDNTSSKYFIIWEQQSSIKASRIKWHAFRYQIPCMTHVTQLALSVFISSLSITGYTMAWDANECDQQFRDNEFIDIGNSKRHQQEGTARVHKVSAMKSGLV